MSITPDEPIVLDAACTSVGAAVLPHGAGLPTFTQSVGPWVHDHRGRSTLASVAVLVDLALGYGARSATGGAPSVVASISVTLNGALPVEDDITAAIDHLEFDPATSTSVLGVSAVGTSGRVLLRATGVTVALDRPRSDPAEAARTAVVLRDQPVVPPATHDGAPIEWVRAMARDGAVRGALASHLDLHVTSVDAGRLAGRWAVLPWTLNPMGSAQGGTMLAVLSTFTDLTLDTVVPVADVPRLAELHVDFFRSPTIDGGPLTIRSTTTRRSRRFANVDCELLDTQGRIVAQSRASALLVPA